MQLVSGNWHDCANIMILILLNLMWHLILFVNESAGRQLVIASNDLYKIQLRLQCNCVINKIPGLI